jgi:Predicted nucleic acid-binding protein, contains PIN domain
MISSPSRLNSDHRVLVIDASVAINLLGTGNPADLLRMLQRKVLIDEVALNEVTSDPYTKCSGRDAMETLARTGLIFPARLSDLAFETFLELTGATPPDDLGDGEAATLSQAFDIGAVPVIDERKATRIAVLRRPKHPILHTIDLLGCSTIAAALSKRELGDVIYAALTHARMRVPIECRDWVCNMIGLERAKSCPSLGSLKSFGQR